MMNDSFRADLHSHTTCSDGTLTPSQLVKLAKRIGLSGLSITDHDTIEAYPEARMTANELGILLGTGVELSCSFRKQNVHILGYDFFLESRALHAFCQKHVKRRAERNEKILEKLKKKKMPISLEEIKQANLLTTTLGRPHIAKCMVEKGYVKSIREAFNMYIGDGKSCCDAEDTFSAEETISVIHEAKGKAFIAHPHLFESAKFVNELLELPFDGIECHYGRHVEQKWMLLAKEKGLLMSGGSDFHGHEGYVELGASWVDESTFSKIFSQV